jgi:FAD/FMN-containing dehydrogenase
MFIVVEWPLSEAPDSYMAYARQKWKALEPHTDGWYTNDVDKESEKLVNANYQGNYERLVKIKNQYDPTNLFRLNANVRPTA